MDSNYQLKLVQNARRFPTIIPQVLLRKMPSTPRDWTTSVASAVASLDFDASTIKKNIATIDSTTQYSNVTTVDSLIQQSF